MTRYEGMTPAERTAHLASRVVRGEMLRAAEIADEYGITRQGAYAAMGIISRVLPVYNEGGVWRLMDVIDGVVGESGGYHAD